MYDRTPRPMSVVARRTVMMMMMMMMKMMMMAGGYGSDEEKKWEMASIGKCVRLMMDGEREGRIRKHGRC